MRHSNGKPVSTQELISLLGYRNLPPLGFPERVFEYNDSRITVRCVPENKGYRPGRRRLEYKCESCRIWLCYAGSSVHNRAHHPK